MSEILGIGSLLADRILKVDEDFLRQIGGEKGGMEHLPLEKIHQIIEFSGQTPTTTPGGSAANVIRGLGHFGRSCALLTKAGTDLITKELIADLSKQHIHTYIIPSSRPIGTVLSLVTPDGQRTMRTYLGASSHWQPQEIPFSAFESTRLVHMEGYLLLHSDVTEQAMAYAKKAGAHVSLDLSSFEVVVSHKEQIRDLLGKYVDVVIANEDEARLLTGSEPRESCNYLKNICSTAVITMGSRGCWIGHQGILSHYPAYPVNPIDTTGAGDLFTSGFLHGLLSGLPLEECAHIGAVAARSIVQVLGTALSEDQWHSVKQQTGENREPWPQ
jgi:sugar/nucleoside kinase (ribokinase family)